MAYVDNAWYVSSAGWSAVAAWATGAAKSVGNLVRQNAAPTVGNERVFVCIVAGTTHATTEPTWTVTRGAKTTDNTVTWQECTGHSAINGDAANTPQWTVSGSSSGGVKNTSVSLGVVIKNDAGTHYFICTTAGTAGNGSEPSWNTTTGATTTDNTVTWTCIGTVGSFTGGQGPHKIINNACQTNWGAAGNRIFVKNDHDVSHSLTFVPAGASTLTAPWRIMCHNGGAYPPVEANITIGAKETSSALNAGSTALGLHLEGIEFVGSSASGTHVWGAGQSWQYHKNCKYTISSATSGLAFSIGLTNGRVVLDNPTFKFAHVGQFFLCNGGHVYWQGGSVDGSGSLPTNLVSGVGGANAFPELEIAGADLSALGSGKQIVADNVLCNMRFVECKLGASVTKGPTTPTRPYRIEFINCNSGDVNYDNAVYDYQGQVTTETTIVLSGGASDGTQAVSHKMVTNANALIEHPLVGPWISVWNEAVGSAKALTIQGIWGGGAVPNDDEIWVEVEYPGTSGFPIASYVNDRKATLVSTAAGQAAGSGTWGGSTTKFALSVTFTPQEKGWINARVKQGKASTTSYYDPKPLLS